MTTPDDAGDNEFDKEHAAIDAALEKDPYVIRFYERGTGVVANELLYAMEDDDNGEDLSSEFCDNEIQGGTIAIHAVEADCLVLLYDRDSYYGAEEEEPIPEGGGEGDEEDEEVGGPSYAAFALVNGRSLYQKKGEKVLYVDIICTSRQSRQEKKRYGAAMIQAIESFAKERGFRAVELDALSNAKDFYVKMGYTSVGEGDDGTVMRKTLATGGRKTRRNRKTKRRIL